MRPCSSLLLLAVLREGSFRSGIQAASVRLYCHITTLEHDEWIASAIYSETCV
jgi:hypothetical protein